MTRVQAVPEAEEVTVLCTVSSDAHAAAGAAFGSDAYTQAARHWQQRAEAAGRRPLTQLVVRHIALQVQPLGGPGLVLHAAPAMRAAWAGTELTASAAPCLTVRCSLSALLQRRELIRNTQQFVPDILSAAETGCAL